MKESLNNTNESIKNPKGLKGFLRKFKEKMLGSIKMSDINEVIKKNMERYPGISENQAAGREQVTIDGKTGFLNGDGKLGTINGDGKFLTYEKLDQVTKKNMERYPGISEDQAAGREQVTIDGKTGFLNGDGKLGAIDGDGKFVTYEKLDQVTKKNMERYPGISEDQAAGREEITINGKTGFLNGDGEII